MPKIHKKNNLSADIVDYKGKVENFLFSNKIAFIPEEQKNTNRYHWHSEGEKYGLATKTIKIWRTIPICGMHKRPITGVREGACCSCNYVYECDYKCKYRCDEDDYDCTGYCCYRDTYQTHKLRTVVIFNKETSRLVMNMNPTQIKDYLVKENIIKIHNSRYCLLDIVH